MLKTGIEPAARELLELACGPVRTPTRVEVAREHERRVAQRFTAGDLQLIAAQHHRMAAELDDADLEGDPRARRGLLEHEADGARGERLRTAWRVLQLSRAIEQRCELVGVQLRAGKEMARHQGAGQVRA
jgi:hypothetical protein